jgi:hypothetical protein
VAKSQLNQDARAIAYYESGPDAGSEEKTIGLAIYYVDVNNYKSRRVVIKFLSVTAGENLETWIGLATDYIFSNDTCQEIFTNLYHHLDITTKKLVCDKPTSLLFKNKGYKWKQLVNDALAGKRSTVFFLPRDKEKYPVSEECLELIKFTSAGIFSDYEANDSVWICKSPRDFISPNDRQYIVLYSLLSYLDYDIYRYDVDCLGKVGTAGNYGT